MASVPQKVLGSGRPGCAALLPAVCPPAGFENLPEHQLLITAAAILGGVCPGSQLRRGGTERWRSDITCPRSPRRQENLPSHQQMGATLLSWGFQEDEVELNERSAGCLALGCLGNIGSSPTPPSVVPAKYKAACFQVSHEETHNH